MGKQADYRLILLGRNTIQNILLTEFLHSELGCECTLQDTLPATYDKISVGTHLFLIDISSYAWEKVIDFINRSKIPAESAWFSLLNMQKGEAYDYLLEQEGLKGIFYEDTTQEQLIKGINTIFSGECWFSRKMMARYLTNHRHGAKRSCSTIALLTKKEKEILQFIALGDTNAAISKRLSVSVHTIKTHVYNIFRKIGVKNRIQAAKWMSNNVPELLEDSISPDLSRDRHLIN